MYSAWRGCSRDTLFADAPERVPIRRLHAVSTIVEHAPSMRCWKAHSAASPMYWRAATSGFRRRELTAYTLSAELKGFSARVLGRVGGW